MKKIILLYFFILIKTTNTEITTLPTKAPEIPNEKNELPNAVPKEKPIEKHESPSESKQDFIEAKHPGDFDAFCVNKGFKVAGNSVIGSNEGFKITCHK